MPDVHSTDRIPPISVSDITDEIWLEIARQHAGDLPQLVAAERARAAGLPGNGRSVPPGPLPLPALLGLEGPAFIAGAYWTLLNRAPDEGGSAYVTAQLARGRSKVELLYQLQASVEGRQLGRPMPGLRQRYWVHRVYRLPLLGPLFRAGASGLRRAGMSRLLAGDLAVTPGRRPSAAAQQLEQRLAEQQVALELATRRLTAAQEELGRKAQAVAGEQAQTIAALAKQNAGLARQLAATEASVIETLLGLTTTLTRLESRIAALEAVTQPAFVAKAGCALIARKI